MSEDYSNEIWRPVVGYEGLYEVSDMGRVRSLDRKFSFCSSRSSMPMPRTIKGRILSIHKVGVGYCSVVLYSNSVKSARLVHTVVLEAFVGPCPLGMEGCHNDGVKDNNRVENLRWDTHVNNCKDRIRHGTAMRGESCHLSKLKESDVIFILNHSHEMSRSSLAKKFGVSREMIKNIQFGRMWKHVTRPDFFDISLTKGSKRLMAFQAVQIYGQKGLRTQAAVAKEYGIHPETVGKIWRHESWASVTKCLDTNSDKPSTTDQLVSDVK